jgi:cytochrome c peroxidase
MLPYYAELFNDAYGSTDVDIDKISTALASFTGSIVSQNTRFDKFRMGVATLSGLELQGKNLFFTKYNCNSCHQSEFLNGYEIGGGFVNIGLNADYIDNGLGTISGSTADNGKFKIPNLRNIALTAPYMHDGRFETLDEVLDHYSHGIANHPNLDGRLKSPNNNAPMLMNIPEQEKGAIIAFLNTLTDYAMITDPKFSSPFKFQ